MASISSNAQTPNNSGHILPLPGPPPLPSAQSTSSPSQLASGARPQPTHIQPSLGGTLQTSPSITPSNNITPNVQPIQQGQAPLPITASVPLPAVQGVSHSTNPPANQSNTASTLPQAPPSQTQNTAQSSLIWGVPRRRFFSFTLVPWLLGVSIAVSHHVLYTELNGRSVTRHPKLQRGITGVGILFSLAVQYCFKYAIQEAFLQCIWKSFRDATFKLRTIDDLFKAPDSLVWIVNLEVWKQAKIAWFIALFMWILKLLTIAPPTTLDITANGVTAQETENCTVFSLDFQRGVQLSSEESENSLSMIYYQEDIIDDTLPRLNARLENICTATAYQGEVVLPASPLAKNCSYDLVFYAPAYDCRNEAFEESPWQSDDVLKTDWSTEDVAGERKIYLCQPVEDVLWFAYSHLRDGVRNESSIHERDRDVDKAGNVTDNDYVRQCFKCTDYNASYAVTLSFAGTGAAIRVNNRTLMNRIPYDSTSDAPTLYFDQEPNRAMHRLLSNWLEGNITLNLTTHGNKPNIPSSLILGSTKLVNSEVPFGDSESDYYYGVPHMLAAVQELHMNATLTLLSASSLYYFLDPLHNHTCIAYIGEGAFHYEKGWLLGVYFSAAFVTIVIVIIGYDSALQNNMLSGDSVSTIIATSRSSEFEPLTRGESTGRQPLGNRLKEADLKFGQLRGADAQKRLGFGQATDPIVMGYPYR